MKNVNEPSVSPCHVCGGTNQFEGICSDCAEPSVSEPARDKCKCGHHFIEHVEDFEGPDESCHQCACEQFEPVIAPQPTPPDEVCKICNDPTCGSLQATPQPTPEPPRHGFILRCTTCNCASASDRTNKTCAFDCHCHWTTVIAPPPTPEPHTHETDKVNVCWACMRDRFNAGMRQSNVRHVTIEELAEMYPAPGSVSHAEPVIEGRDPVEFVPKELKLSDKGAAPQGVGKLSPEPHLSQPVLNSGGDYGETMGTGRGQEALSQAENVRGNAKTGRKQSVSSVSAEGRAEDAPIRPTPISAEMPMVPVREGDRPVEVSHAKGVEGVGQTARECYYCDKLEEHIHFRDGILGHEESYWRDGAVNPEAGKMKVCPKVEAYLAAQTITLRAELQQAHDRLNQVCQMCGHDACDCVTVAELQAENAELRSRLQEALRVSTVNPQGK